MVLSTHEPPSTPQRKRVSKLEALRVRGELLEGSRIQGLKSWGTYLGFLHYYTKSFDDFGEIGGNPKPIPEVRKL